MGNISVIVENSDLKEDDDAEDMVVMETRGGGSDSLESNSTYKADDQLTQEHGHLVAQILETQKELANNDNVDVIPKKTNIVRNIDFTLLLYLFLKFFCQIKYEFVISHGIRVRSEI